MNPRHLVALPPEVHRYVHSHPKEADEICPQDYTVEAWEEHQARKAQEKAYREAAERSAKEAEEARIKAAQARAAKEAVSARIRYEAKLAEENRRVEQWRRENPGLIALQRLKYLSAGFILVVLTCVLWAWILRDPNPRDHVFLWPSLFPAACGFTPLLLGFSKEVPLPHKIEHAIRTQLPP